MESPFCQPDLKLIETFGWDGTAYPRLARHRARLQASAAALGFMFDPAAFCAAVPASPGADRLRLRLTLDRQGTIAVTISPLAASPPLWRLTLAPDRLTSADPRLAHKSTDRALYDHTRAGLGQGFDEAVFLNERGELCEGTITSVFFDCGDGLCTPPLTCGCLPGILRGALIAQGQVREAVLHAADLPGTRLFVGNSLRGLIPARLQP